ncbi:hypothetical protein EYF80_058478 [Liparis tanakae]|uniref:Uncharacterized protein n=1 Tax=Liparis tanakae TaxID=230148 RepID=A0A4Z2ES09_9TELE|nr:hypothetical protein EYF80_058478 [Liparis tanakae]
MEQRQKKSSRDTRRLGLQSRAGGFDSYFEGLSSVPCTSCPCDWLPVLIGSSRVCCRPALLLHLIVYICSGTHGCCKPIPFKWRTAAIPLEPRRGRSHGGGGATSIRETRRETRSNTTGTGTSRTSHRD